MKFKAVIQPAERANAMGIVVPVAVVVALGGGKRAKVVVCLLGHSYRSTLAVMGGQYLLPLAAEHRRATGLTGTEGAEVEVELTLDTTPRKVAVPPDLALALDAAGLTARFAALAYSHRKEHVRAIEEARAPETRARRIAKAVQMLGG